MIVLHRHNQQYFKQIKISSYLKIRINEKILLLSLDKTLHLHQYFKF